MIHIRKSEARGTFDHGWLQTAHSFSFADYYDPRYMGFRALRVINEDRVRPGAGFPPHGHRDMDIVSYVLSGALEHRDSLGNGSVIRRHDLQRMSAGTGIRHSEYNASAEEGVHFFQIWIVPERTGLVPGYAQRAFDPVPARGGWQLLASRDGRAGSITVHQDVELWRALPPSGTRLPFALRPGRHAWVQLARGRAHVDGHPLAAGDGAALSDVAGLDLVAATDAEVLLFDLA